MSQLSFAHRILIVDDDPDICALCKMLLETRGYEVLTAGGGFEALLALRHSLPDIIISDLNMPVMSGYEFLSVVRRRFPTVSVIVISGECSGVSFPESVCTDAYFAKGQYSPDSLFAKLAELIESPPRYPAARPAKSAGWVKNDKGEFAVTCTDCLRTFPLAKATFGVNEVVCEFCSCGIRFEVSDDRRTGTKDLLGAHDVAQLRG